LYGVLPQKHSGFRLVDYFGFEVIWENAG
jgi:hypothetical protein